jgi:uncharacterized protein (DUF58 family)
MSLVSRYLEPALVERLNALQLSARRVVEGQTLGQHRSPVRGASVEFHQHRAYVPGDEPRRLDWRVFARTDRPFVRQYEQETNLRCAILLDRSGSMGYGGKSDEVTKRRSDAGGSKFEYAAKLTASLAYLMLGQNESVGLATFDRRVETWLAPHGGSAQLSRVVDVLERSTPGSASDVPAAMHDLADRLGRRSLVIIISDFFAPVETLNRALARLRHARHEIISLRVLHQDESEFPFRNWVRLRGLEGEAARLCEPALVRQQYLDRFNRHASALADAHKAHAAEFHSFVTAMPVGDALVNFLRHRALGGPAGAGSVAHV